MSASQNLVVCCDGTNNTLTGGLQDTNVLQLFDWLRSHTADRTDTLLYYDPGVGSPDAAPPTDPTDLVKRRVQRIAGLASGRGVYENITEGYRFLMQHWRSDADRIFCFGFSRGAFTARAIVGMVNLFGMLRPEHEALLPTLVRIYFSQPAFADQAHGRKKLTRALTRRLHIGLARPDNPTAEAIGVSEEAARVTRRDLAEQVQRNFARPAGVHWVGVWDTVESVGLPFLFSRDNPATATFHDKPRIRNVRHALSLDEHRYPFLPRLYDAPSRVTDGGRTLKQLWFPGVHCDVGGGYLRTEAGLSDASLIWMIDEVAPEFGLPPLTRRPADREPPTTDPGTPRRTPFPADRRRRHDALWDTPWWALAGMAVRSMRTARVWTNGQEQAAEAESRRTGRRPLVGVEVDVRAAEPCPYAGPSVWDRRRKLWPLVAAVGVAAFAVCMSGRNLPAAVDPSTASPPTAWVDAACNHALQQVATLSPVELRAGALLPGCGVAPAGGLRDPRVWQRTLRQSPAWAAAWDFLTIAGLGYLIARLASRGFTFLAGLRWPGQPAPRWQAIGFLPLAAVGADVAENLALLAALAVDAAGIGWLTSVLLAAGGVLSVIKLLGYAGCVFVFVPLRLASAVLPRRRIGQVGRLPQPEPAAGAGTDGRRPASQRAPT